MSGIMSRMEQYSRVSSSQARQELSGAEGLTYSAKRPVPTTWVPLGYGDWNWAALAGQHQQPLS